MDFDRGFRIDGLLDAPLEVAARSAHSAGRIPDFVADDLFIGSSPVERLDLVDVSVAELGQLVRAGRLPRWVIAKNPLSGGYVETKALMRNSGLATVCEEAGLPEHRPLLVASDRDVHDRRQQLHPRLPVLQHRHRTAHRPPGPR